MGRAMKDSGIEWIGEIPEKWKMNKLKYIAEFRNGIAHEQGMDVEGKYTVVNSKFVSTEGAVRFYCNKQIMPLAKDDVCIVLSDVPNGRAYAKCYVIECDDVYTLNQRVGCFSKIRINLRYFYYYLNRNYGLLLYDDGINQTNLRKPDLLNLMFPLPPLPEQHSIADFLDRKCGIIDSTIEKQKAVIEKLKLYRMTVLTEVVTQGIRKIDDCKKSLSEMLSYNIPAYWHSVKFSRIATVKANLVSPDLCKTYLHIAPNNIEKETGRLLDCRTVEDDGVISDNHHFYQGQIIYSKIRPKLNKIIIAPFEGLCSADMYPIDSKLEKKYLWYYMLSDAFTKQIPDENRVKMPKINKEELAEIKVAVPPKDEQKEIVEYLDRKCTQIDNTIEKKQKLIEKLIDYKKSLIFECVTGKKEVV